jgi:1,4-alpha-glucan branching enzyme
VLRQNKEGIIFGITFIDHQTKCVFNGSDLGKQYSAAAILERCEQKNTYQENQSEALQQKQKIPPSNHPKMMQSEGNAWLDEESPQKSTQKILDEIINPLETNNCVPFELKQTRRKRKRQSNYLK